MRNPIPLALALALVSTGLQLAALFPEHTPQYWQLLVLIGIAGQLLAVIVVTGARRTRRAFAAVVQTDPLTQIGNRRRLVTIGHRRRLTKAHCRRLVTPSGVSQADKC